MIHFFRKIRQHLISQNKISKYVAYALGEIFLVMIGILLALYFNNLNTENEDRKKEEWYLINIVEDIEYQKVYLKFLIDYYKESINIEKSIIKDYSIKNSFSEVDSLDSKLNYLMTSYYFPNTNGTYKELVSSGQLGLIKNKKLSIDIINYYISCETNYDDFKKEINHIFYKEIYPVLTAYSQIEVDSESSEANDIGLNKMNDELATYLKSKLEKPESKFRLLNAIKTKLLIHQNFIEITKEVLADSDSLIIKIDKDLGLTSDMVNNYD